MKPLQIGLLVLVGALGGALIMKFTQRPKPVAAPVVSAAPVPAAPVAEAAPPAGTPAAPAESAAEPKAAATPDATAPPAKPKPAPVIHPVNRASPMRQAPPVTVAQNLPPAQPERPASAAPLPVEQPSAPPISNEPAPAPVMQPAPPPVAQQAPSVTLQAGLAVPIRLGESLSSEHNQAGDEFTGTLDAPLTVDGFVIAERGAHVEGRVVDAQKSGHMKGKASLSLELTKLDTSDGQHVAIKTETLRKQGATMATGDQVGVVAAAAGIGAVIGALAGGGKGAAIGAGAGGAAGGGGVVAMRDKAVSLPTETKLSFRLSAAVTLTEKLNP